MAARPKKCAPTTNEIQAPAACGAFLGPLSRLPDCDGYDLDRYDEPVAPSEAATCQHGGHPGRGTMATEHDQNRHEGGNREEWKSHCDVWRQRAGVDQDEGQHKAGADW